MNTKNFEESPFDGIKRAKDERSIQLSQETGKFSRNHCTKIYVGKQIVGVVEDGEFQKRVHGSRHFLRKPRAIAMDESSLIQARKLGAKIVKIIDLDTGFTYIVTIEVIYQKGFRFNRGYGDQIGLTMNHWQRIITSNMKVGNHDLFARDASFKVESRTQSIYRGGNQPLLFD